MNNVVPLIFPETIKKDNRRNNRYITMLARMATTVEPVAAARIAACMVYKNEVISFGICQKKSHPFQAKFGKNEDAIFLHAENDCIKNALKEYSLSQIASATLYVARVKYFDHTRKRFVFGLAKPCTGCSRAVATFGISRVIYSTETGYEVL